MFQVLFVTLLIVAISLALLCVRFFFQKDGKFPNTHISGSKAMRQRGIHCVKAQDREARLKKKLFDN